MIVFCVVFKLKDFNQPNQYWDSCVVVGFRWPRHHLRVLRHQGREAKDGRNDETSQTSADTSPPVQAQDGRQRRQGRPPQHHPQTNHQEPKQEELKT